ncbi:NAD-dependent epimerase/dehydratase family protein [Bacillus sp. FJAT-27445]|uniref:NAD-dependent epimerase/dehydratase family protein n=1 Tax=Bacillus sp. FJAT-27445 TaxID=1679166 RepID=UPI0007432563|nr:NAD-dependent epimerase/dehydratase family protein [Bacillus sp. FJAT-27445]
MERKALVLGATGLVGGYLVRKLIARDEFSEIKILSRRKTGINHPKVRELIVPLEELSRFSNEFNVDDIFCCLGTTMKKAGSKDAFEFVDLSLPFQAAQLGISEGAKRYLAISSMGANKGSAFFYSRVKGEMEEKLSTYPFQAIHLFRPSLLIGDRKEFRFGEKLAEWLSKPLTKIMPVRLKKFSPIHAEIVASAMVAAALGELTGINVHESDQLAGLGGKGE